MRVLAIVNPAARAVATYRSGDWRERVTTAFAAAFAHETGAEAVVAGGGDGTVGSVAGALAGHGMPLGVLPLGTLNHFAYDLGIPFTLDGAIAVIAAGHVASIDVGEVNGHVFVNNSSIGLYP